MRCSDDLPDKTDGDFGGDRRNVRAGTQDMNGDKRPNDTPTGGAQVDANAGITTEPPDKSDTHIEGQDFQEGHEFCPTWGQGYTTTHDTGIPHHSANPSPHSHPPWDYETPRSRSARSATRLDNDSPRHRCCDCHLVAAETVQRSLTTEAHQ